MGTIPGEFYSTFWSSINPLFIEVVNSAPKKKEV